MSHFAARRVQRGLHPKTQQEKETEFKRVFGQFKRSKQPEHLSRILVQEFAKSSGNCIIDFPFLPNGTEQLQQETTPRKTFTRSLLHIPEKLRHKFGYVEKSVVSREGHLLVRCCFKKPTFCDECSKLLLEREGLRCKRCKKKMHETCGKIIDPCQGSPIGSYSFNPQNSSNSDFNCLPSDDQVDSVYQVIKQGMDLRSKKEESEDDQPCSSKKIVQPHPRKCIKHQHSEPLPTSDAAFQGIRRAVSSDESLATLVTKVDVLPTSEEPDFLARKSSQVSLLKHTDESSSVGSEISFKKQANKLKKQSMTNSDQWYVALHNFDKQEKEDLSMRAGNKLRILDNKDETWWMAQIDSKTGYVPARFVMKLRKNEEVYLCLKSTIMKTLTDTESHLKKNQIVAVRTNWPVEDKTVFYARSPSVEGYIHREDLGLL